MKTWRSFVTLITLFTVLLVMAVDMTSQAPLLNQVFFSDTSPRRLYALDPYAFCRLGQITS